MALNFKQEKTVAFPKQGVVAGQTSFKAPALPQAATLGSKLTGQAGGFGPVQAANEAMRRLGMGLNRVPGVHGVLGRIPQVVGGLS